MYQLGPTTGMQVFLIYCTCAQPVCITLNIYMLFSFNTPASGTCTVTFTISVFCSVSPLATMYCLKESSLTVTEGAGVVEFTATRTGTVGQPDCINVTVVDISTQGRAPLCTH